MTHGVDSSGSEATAGRPGNWRAQAAGRLLAPLRSALIASGVLQAVITLVQLAPFLLLVELARLLVSGASRVAACARSASPRWRCWVRHLARRRADAVAACRRCAVRPRICDRGC